MIQENFKDVVFEFSKRVSAISAVKAVVLFGSVGCPKNVPKNVPNTIPNKERKR